MTKRERIQELKDKADRLFREGQSWDEYRRFAEADRCWNRAEALNAEAKRLETEAEYPDVNFAYTDVAR